jgi:hypothetical protein
MITSLHVTQHVNATGPPTGLRPAGGPTILVFSRYQSVQPKPGSEVRLATHTETIAVRCPPIDPPDWVRHPIQLIVSHALSTEDSFLLSDTNPVILEMVSAPTAAVGIDDTPDDALWPAQHAQMAASKGLAWWKPSTITDETRAKYPGIATLGERQLDILATAGVGFPETTTRLIESSQSVERVTFSSADSSAIKCVIPRMRRWITSRCRIMHGAEALALQGMHFPPSIIQQFSSTFLYNVAGNAFHSGCAALATMTVFSTLAIGLHHSATRMPPAIECISAAAPTDLSIDELLDGW